MEINSANLAAAFTGFNTIFQTAFNAAAVNYLRIATPVPSTTSQEVYPWLGQTTRFREWVGNRRIQNLASHDFAIKNKTFENTVSIGRDKFEDDTYGVYTPVIAQLGMDTKVHPDILSFGLLKSGTSSLCYDGQYFFDNDHPTFNEQGNPITVSNVDAGGNGPWWYLLDTTQVVKPIILQQRKPYKFVPKTSETDDNVFNRNEFVYGVDGRSNVGFGLWQMAFASNQPLTPDNYGAARAAMGSLRGENGDALAIEPDLLVVPPALEGAANTITKADVIDATSNVWKGTADVCKTARVL